MSQWLGPSWGQWTMERRDHNDAISSSNSANKRANHNFEVAEENGQAADKWRAHTEKLRIELDRVWEMYQDKSSAERGQGALKEAALLEIERMDPVNKMLSSNYRQKIYDEAHKGHLAKKGEN